MIHIATVHFKSNHWIALQRDYLRRHLHNPFRVYGWLNEIAEYPSDAFNYVCTEPVMEHAVKLNLLADMICFSARSEDDVIIFIDGDAFPIDDLDPLINDKLEKHRLIAVQRTENNGDSQPHPCFCMTTVGSWRALKGDWNQGHTWTGADGRPVTDVGGNLLKTVQEHQVPWLPLHRSGGAASHPVLFSIYAGLVYHHGAGFRHAVTRHDVSQEKPRLSDKLAAVFPWRMKRVVLRRMRERIGKRNAELSKQLYRQLQSDPSFFQKTSHRRPQAEANHAALITSNA
jgi:hypothetical protein